MMAVPFLAFSACIGLALTGRKRVAVAVLVVALGLSIGMLVLHATDPLPVSL